MAARIRNSKLRSRFRGRALLAAFAGCSVLGCVSAESEVAPARSADATSGEKVLCLDDYVQSIWKGKDLGGPDCADPSAYAEQRDQLVRGRIERVCERTEIRTILSGEPATRFTRQACADHAAAYEHGAIDRACKTASRTLKAREEEFNDAQAAACDRYLHQASARSAAGAVARSDQLRATRASNFASAERPDVAGTVAGASALARFFSNARANADRQQPEEAGSDRGAAVTVAGAGAPDLATCENRYVESIWQGRDLSGPECGRYVDGDGYPSRYRRARIQNVCDGAAIQAMRRGQPVTQFALQACAAALRPPPSSAAPDPARAIDGTAPPAQASGRGLSEAEIAQTVDANWRSIGRDCLLVEPSARPQEHATQVNVTMTVSPSGQVRDVSARGSRRRELQSCIESSVRGWRFPSASAETEVAFPLTFVGP
jgi:hypothetical protein